MVRALLFIMLLAAPGNETGKKKEVTRAEAETMAADAAGLRGYREARVLDARPEPGMWRVAVVGRTKDGCGLLLTEIATPARSIRFRDRRIVGAKVQVEECVESWRAEAPPAGDDSAYEEWLAARDAAEELPIVDDGAEEPTEEPADEPAGSPVNGEPADASPVEKKPAKDRAVAAADEDAARPTPRPSRPPVGVPEGDRFLDAYRACIATKVPESKREGMRLAAEALADAWRDAAAQGVPLGPTCASASESVKASVRDYDCAW